MDKSNEVYIVTLDLGTTNIKACVFDANMKNVGYHSSQVMYRKQDLFVEFDPEEYWCSCVNTIRAAIESAGIGPEKVGSIAVTGQAESLIVLDKHLKPLRYGISWMDERSREECQILQDHFLEADGYAVTGQPGIIPTWPITKILWIKKNEPQVFEAVTKYVLIKDFIIHRLTGRLLAELSVYNFSYYLDIVRLRYWEDILDFVGIHPSQLPELIEPGENAGSLTNEAAMMLGLSMKTQVNVGALDHFAGMIGTGNVREGIISETTGTVLAIATLVHEATINEYRIPRYYNAIRNTYVLMPVCESGGVCLEWFKKEFLVGESYTSLNEGIERSSTSGANLVFLPYITGTNAPDYDDCARGVFFGLRLQHSRYDLARTVMEGITFLLKKNVEYLAKITTNVKHLISLGGGAKSPVWNQMKADITGMEIHIPEYEEAASLGAGMLAGVALGLFPDIDDAVQKIVKIKKIYTPERQDRYEDSYELFLELYDRLKPVFKHFV